MTEQFKDLAPVSCISVLDLNSDYSWKRWLSESQVSKLKEFIFGGFGVSISVIRKHVKSSPKHFHPPRDVTELFLQRLQNLTSFHVFRKSFRHTNSALWKTSMYGLENIVSCFFLNGRHEKVFFEILFMGDICCLWQWQ